MRVLVACEFSGKVRDAFRARGHDAWSCDLLPSESAEGGYHLEGDVRWWLNNKDWPWDLMIAHPPCTYLASSGARWWKDRGREQRAAVKFVLALANANIPRIAIENPIGCLSTYWRKPDQIIQPWQFGHNASKATCLWLKNLAPLKPTRVLAGDRHTRRANQTASGQNKLSPSPDRWKLRSETYSGIARAMAQQWG